ncbi:heme-dependent oxidative N-demethylase family protein [Rossellomorea sp. NS-SX7]|uniref:heme-dependent oxidative N-demethylase family protein n=1 Tax=Rossellomorea sp. NS-SX7 TaxID=3463856 RepID=UPI004059BF5A
MKKASAMRDFPYPFKDPVYRYSNNSIPLPTPNCIEVTSTYKEEMGLKRTLLANHPDRCFQSLPHTLQSQWEVLSTVIDHLVTYYPQHFSIEKNNRNWTFHNNILNDTHTFIFGGESSLPYQPLDFIGRHVQEDLIFMMQRDGNLYLDAGQLCFPANWSLAFNAGMTFKEIHRPIPGFKEEGLDERILTFLLRMEAGDPWVRRNWSLMAGNRLDTSLETFDQWGVDRRKVTKDNAGEFVHFRVEVQKLFRMPGSNGILFTIHTHLLPLEAFASNPEWLHQFYQILGELPESISEYKGIEFFKEPVLHYLKARMIESG